MPLSRSSYNSVLKGFTANVKSNAKIADNTLTPIDQVAANNQKNADNKEPAGQKAGNAATDVAHGIAAASRFLVGGTAKLINQGVQEGKQVVDTTKMLADTGNPTAESNANAQSQKDYAGFQKGKGGILNEGTLTSESDAKTGALKTGVKDIGGGTLVAASEILPFAKGLGIAAKGGTFLADGVEATRAARAAEVAATAGEDASKASKVTTAAVAGGKRVATNAAYGAAGSAGNQLATTGTVNPFETAKDAASSATLGELFHGGGKVLGKIFSKGSDAALADAKAAAAKNADITIPTDTIDGAAKAAASEDQKLLPQGNIGNKSTSVVPGNPAIPGDPGTPSKVPVDDGEYKARFDALSKSYDKGMKAAQQAKGTLAQSIAADNVHEQHLAALNQLDHEFANGKDNPDYKPATSGTAATPDTTVDSGFQIMPDAKGPAVTNIHDSTPENAQRAQLHTRVSQIDAIVKNAQANGTTRTAEELRGLMRERQGAQDVLDGKSSHDDVYGPISPAGSNESNALPGADNVHALPGEIADAGKGVPDEAAASSIISQVPKATVGDTKAAPLARNFVVNKYHQLIKPVQDAAKGMAPEDIKKLETIELAGNSDPQAAAGHLQHVASTAKNPEQFLKVVNAMRSGYDARMASDTALGRDVGTRNNYLPHLFDTTHQPTADKLDELEKANATRIVAGPGTPGYTKARTLDTLAQADDLGLKRKNANVLDDFYQSMNMAGYEHGKQAMIGSLNEAHPGQVQFGKVGLGTDGKSYSELKIPGAKGITMPEDLADQYNKRALPKDSTGFFGKYDKANGLLKYAKLGGGTFHAFTTLGTTLGHQTASLNLLKHPIDNLRVAAGTLSKTAHAANMDKLTNDGSDHADGLSTVDRMNLAGVTTKAKEILGDANTSFVDKLKNKNPVSKLITGIHDMVFDRQIPESKALIFKQATAHLNANDPADLAKMRKVGSAVNNLGGINRAVDGLTPKTTKQLSRVVLATDFTEGKFRTIGNALTKWGANSPQGKVARQMVVGKSLVFAIPGMAALVASGTLNPKDPKAMGDAFMSQILNPQLATSWRTPPSKSNPNGTPISLKLPSSFISEIGKVIAPALDPLSPDRTSGIKDYASARLAALPSVGEQVGTNRDYFGDPIYGKDKNGNPISAKQTAENISNQVSPIPVVQGVKSLDGQNLAESAANVAGFRATSDPTSAEAGHTKRITDFYNTYNKAYSDRSKVVNNMNTLVRTGNNAQAARIAQEYNASIDSRVMPFRSKYATSTYNPAFDQKFIQLKIPTTTRAFTSREKAIKESDAVLK